MECVFKVVLCGLLLVTPVVHADIFAGKLGGATASDTVVRFTDDQSGNVAPAAILGGATTGLEGAQDLAWLQQSRELYVSDFWGKAIRVYNTLSGDPAPVRSITSLSLGQPRQLVLVPQHNELLVITSSLFISTYALDADGTPAQIRQIGLYPNPISGLDNPSGLAYNPATDEIYVGDYESDGKTATAEVLVFPRTASGDVAPTRVIAGSNALLGGFVIDVEFSAERNELYVLAEDPSETYTYSLNTFAPSAGGNVAPLRRIAGAATGLFQSFDLAYDSGNDQLIVASDRENSLALPGLLFWPRTTNGNIAPSKTIRGALTGATLGNGWGSVLYVDLSFLFADGFEGP
jgi:DNA-binding beta-propeller fold protein YncE